MRLGASQASDRALSAQRLSPASSGRCSCGWSTPCGSSGCAASTSTWSRSRCPAYVDGLSVIAHKLMELINAEVLLQAVGMEDRVFVTARSRAGVGGRGRAAAHHRRRRARPGGLRGDSRQRPGEVIARLLETLSASNLGVPDGRRDHEPAGALHRRRYPGHRRPGHRADATATPASACGKTAGWWASWPGATWTRPSATASDTPRSRA